MVYNSYHSVHVSDAQSLFGDITTRFQVLAVMDLGSLDYLILDMPLGVVRQCCVRAAQHSLFFGSSRQCRLVVLYCRFDSILVRLTVTTDSFNLLSLLLSLALLFLDLTLVFHTTIDAYLVDLVGSY